MVRSSSLTCWSGSSHWALCLRSRSRFHHSLGDLLVVECILPCSICLNLLALEGPEGLVIPFTACFLFFGGGTFFSELDNLLGSAEQDISKGGN